MIFKLIYILYKRTKKIVDDFLTRLTRKVSGGVYGLLSITFGILGDTLAIIFYSIVYITRFILS